MPKPLPGTFPVYFQNYIDQVAENNLDDAFKNQQQIIDTYFDSIPEEKTITAYEPGKWTLKELLQHVIDTERIFNYRSLAIARKETASLPGFDENDYAANSNANERSWQSLCEELKAVRKTTELLFNGFSDEAMLSSGLANKNPVTVIAMGFITVGHLYHHKKIIEERYLL